MTYLLNFLPKPVMLLMIAGLLAFSVISAFQASRLRSDLQTVRASLSSVRLQWAQEREALSRKAMEDSTRFRAQEASWQQSLTDAQRNHDAYVQDATSRSTASSQSIERLRLALRSRVSASATSCVSPTTSDPIPSPVSSAASDVGELLLACTTRYRQLGIEADAARAAGFQCQESYDALTR